MASMALLAQPEVAHLSFTWLLSSGLFSITVENVWLDRWIRSKIPNFPSLVPEPPGLPWLLTFALVGISCAVLRVGQVLLLRRPGVSRKSKIVAGPTVFTALCLSLIWFIVTSGLASPPRL